MSQPDIYKYELYNDECLKFSQLSRDDSGDEYEGYSFTECRSKKTIFTKWLYERGITGAAKLTVSEWLWRNE